MYTVADYVDTNGTVTVPPRPYPAAADEAKLQGEMSDRGSWFTRFAKATSRYAGRPTAFSVAAGTIVLWSACGPIFGFSDTWQLVINTSTTIVTFLMVFLIQNTQNRDSEAMQIKLDELIRSSQANAALLDLEELPDEELDSIRQEYEQMARKARAELQNRRGRPKSGPPGEN